MIKINDLLERILFLKKENNKLYFINKNNDKDWWSKTSPKLVKYILDNPSIMPNEDGFYLILTSERIGSIDLKDWISDETFNVTYALTDPMMAPSTPDVNEPDKYDIELKLDKNYVNNLIKAKNSITNDNTMGIQDDRNLYGNSILKFIFGGENDYSNKITYDIPLETNTPHIIISELLTFDSDLFKTILNANKSFNHMSMKINTQGLMRLEFVYDDVTSEYFILKKADI
jgi:hypothetical protein